MEDAVGQQSRPGDVIGQPDFGDLARFGRRETGKVERGVEQLVLRQQRHLHQQPRIARFLQCRLKALIGGENFTVYVVVTN